MSDKNKYILDACCGNKKFWFDKENEHTIYMDIREGEETLCDGRTLTVSPDIIGDFRDMPFDDESFKLVVFDPPHRSDLGKNSWMAITYGTLLPSWEHDIRKGFEECFRVLENHGILIFKWNEAQIKLKNILKLTPYKPLFGNRRHETHWVVFMKNKEESK